MRQGARRRRIGDAALAVLIVLATGCGWLQTDFDPGRSRSNDFETTITPTNVSQVVHHTIPNASGNLLIVRDLLVVWTTTGLRTFDRHACPRADNGPCDMVWEYPLANVRGVVSDGRHLFLAGGNDGLIVLDLDGRLVWRWITSFHDDDPGTSLTEILTYRDELVLSVLNTRFDGLFDSALLRFPLDGCGASACAPDATLLTTGTARPVTANVFDDGQALAIDPPTLYAFDIKTGEELWRAVQPSFAGLVARNGRVASADDNSSTVRVFTPARGAACSGVPRTCEPSYVASASRGVRAASAEYLLSLDYGAGGGRLVWHDPTQAGCSPQSPCTPFATSEPYGSWASVGGQVAVGGSVVYVIGEQTIQAYDARAVVGCDGSPRTCAALWSYDFGEYSSGGIKVFDGRLYVGRHVFALPGDVS